MEQHDLEQATAAPESPKRAYVAPRLTAYGDLSHLTQFNAEGFVSDGDPFATGYS